ncbi:MAG: hypothetical protein EPN97_13170 [Alphaproteobacteria bacterium]|nr:MAG: hypothetical protein EPN97_13170 [Alphaproteobacteria bacterium]
MSPEAKAFFQALQWPLWFAIMGFVMAMLGRSRMKRRPGEATNVMRSPKLMLILGIICTVFFVALAILSQIFPDKDASGLPGKPNPVYAYWFLGFASLGLPVIANHFRERHRIEPEELHYRTLTKEGVLWWRGVTKIRYSAAMKWFRLEGANGEVVRISVSLTGLPEFARVALEKIPPESFDAFTRKVLAETAAGNPPSMWQ